MKRTYQLEPEEPLFSSENPSVQSELGRLLNYYSNNKESSDAKKYLEEYLKLNFDKDKTKKILRLNTNLFTNTICWCCRILTINSNAPDFIKERVLKEIEKAELQITNSQNLEEEKLNVIPSVQTHMQNVFDEYVSELEWQIDIFILNNCISSFSPYSWMEENKIKSIFARGIGEHYSQKILELKEAQQKTCEQLVEGYSFLSEKQLNDFIGFYQTIIDDSVKWYHLTKDEQLKFRKPRKKKIKHPSQIVKNFKYLKSWNEHTSVNPEKLLKAQNVLCYNPEKRLLSIYVCDNPHGFDIKGTTLLNYDFSQSFSKTLRKPDEVLVKILDYKNITNVIKYMDTIKSKRKALNGRINCDTILLKIL